MFDRDQTFVAAASLAALLALPVLGGGDAEASEKARIDPAGPAFDAPKPVRERFEKQRAAARPPLRSTPEWAPAPGSPTLHAEGVLHRWEDGVVVLAVQVDQTQAEALELQGAARLPRLEMVRDHSLVEGRYFRVFRVAPREGTPCPGCAAPLRGPDPALLERRVGRRVVLELRESQRGRHLVTDILDPR